MKIQLVLETPRLLLRPFALADAPDLQRLAGAREVARMTMIPHPYSFDMAQWWIAGHRANFESGRGAVFAVTSREVGEFMGVTSLEMAASDEGCAMLGYWLGVPFWGRGFATEAARAVVDYGFGELGLRRVHCDHLGSNPASGRVMQKLGMTREGCRREHIVTWGEAEDLVIYGLLRREWEAKRAADRAAQFDADCDAANVGAEAD